jgi:uncharacterized protein YbaA (DUF1428 family)
MSYVDGYILPVPKKHLAAYKRIAGKAGKIWREHGALDYRECVGDDLGVKFGLPFTRLVKGRLLDRVQVARAPRQGQCQGDERHAAAEDAQGHAVRHQAHELWRVQDAGLGMKR